MGRRKKRPKMETKEELITYLEANKDKELPFVEEIWEKAVEVTKEKKREFKEITVTDYDGTKKTKKIPNGAVNPVAKYFQLVALPQYRKKAQALKKELEYKEKEKKNKKEITADDVIEELDDTEENLFIKELVDIYFSGYKGEDLEFIIDRLSDYYNNYEFNEGSDKFLVVSAVSDEVALRNLYNKRAKDASDENEIKKVRENYMKTLEGLKLLKKQGGKLDAGKNKLTMWIDELEKAGELNIKFEDYEEDKLGDLLDKYLEGVRRSFYEG